jgi:hypothetical protein
MDKKSKPRNRANARHTGSEECPSGRDAATRSGLNRTSTLAQDAAGEPAGPAGPGAPGAPSGPAPPGAPSAPVAPVAPIAAGDSEAAGDCARAGDASAPANRTAVNNDSVRFISFSSFSLLGTDRLRGTITAIAVPRLLPLPCHAPNQRKPWRIASLLIDQFYPVYPVAQFGY